MKNKVVVVKLSLVRTSGRIEGVVIGRISDRVEMLGEVDLEDHHFLNNIY